MLSLHDLPFLNALLNSTSTVFLLFGYAFIRKKNRRAHKFCMITSVIVSGLFLLSYVIYHFNVGSVKYAGEGAARTLYFFILLTHTPLALSLPVLVPITLLRALRERFDKHVKLARITFPIWLYVSVTGVLIYLMLYKLS